jgi:hypothetical protein
LISRSATSTGALPDIRFARETVQPVQPAALSQRIGGLSPTFARTFSRGPNADVNPSAAADIVQYFRNSRLDTFN